MNATTIRLWFVRQTDKARLYSKFPPDRNYPGSEIMDDPSCLVWVPLSIIEHTTKRDNEHHVKLPDWFIEKSGL